jgi:hypothetical protein
MPALLCHDAKHRSQAIAPVPLNPTMRPGGPHFRTTSRLFSSRIRYQWPNENRKQRPAPSAFGPFITTRPNPALSGARVSA